MSASNKKYPSTAKSAPTTTNFSKGLNTYLPNDVLEYEQVRVAQNVRFDKIGEYITRSGLKSVVDPIGSHQIENIPSTFQYRWISISDKTIERTYSTPDKIYSIGATLQASADVYNVAKMSVYDAATNELLGEACANGITTTGNYVAFVFPFGIDTTHTIKIEIRPQSFISEDFLYYIKVSRITDQIAFDVVAAPSNPINGLFEANIGGNKYIMFSYVADSELYVYVREPSGTLIQVFNKYLENPNVTVRFLQNLDEVRFVFGESPYKLSVDSENNWTATKIDTVDLQTDVDLMINVNNIMGGTQQNIMYFDADTNTQALWANPYNTEWAKGVDYTTSATINPFVYGETTTTTISTSTMEALSEDKLVDDIEVGDVVSDENDNYGEVTTITGQNILLTSISHQANPINSYDKFDRRFHDNFPSIRTGDPLTAMFNLGGVVFILTRLHKYYMIMQTADVWTQQTSAAQHGTFSQESVVCNLNYAYYACDDGIYAFNGSTEVSLTEKTIQDLYDGIAYKDNIHLELFNNRLYVFYASGNHGQDTDSCLVYNINLKVWESVDTGLPINITIGRQTASNRFICGSGAFTQLLEFESKNSPIYADLSAPINMDIATGYLHFGSPSQLHRISKWRPEFGTCPAETPYKVRCGFAVDFTDRVKYAFSIDLARQTFWDEHSVWDDPQGYGNSVPTKLSTIPKVYGQFRRCQILYQHHAAFEPVSLKSHTLCVETQRIR